MLICYLLFIFGSRYLQDRRVNLHQIFQEDGKWAAIEKLSFVSELFRDWEGGSKKSLSLRTKLHKMQRGSKIDLLTEKKESCLISAG